MELTNEFTVAVPVETAWSILTDVERIAPCLPGAELREVEGDEYRGVVKIKVGPIATSYQGAARFIELDHVAHRGVLKAEGRETRGQGNANAVITATMTPSGSNTVVTVVTDLAITGKVAQFGRGVLADVSAKLLSQFVENLETTVLASDDSANQNADETVITPTSDVAGEDGAGDATVRQIHSEPAEPVDVGELVGSSVLRRAWPALVILSVMVITWIVRRRHRAADED